MILTILSGIAIVYTWIWWSNIQANSGIVIFTTLSNFFIFKLILVLCTFMIVAPIGLIVAIFRSVYGSKTKSE